MATKFSAIADDSIFEANGGLYRKIDGLYYEELSTGFQSTWNPMFDAGIGAAQPTSVVKEVEPRYLVDSRTRMMTLNPAYSQAINPAINWFGEMWESGEYDCAKEDYEHMASTSVLAVNAMRTLAAITGHPANFTAYPSIVETLMDAYNKAW
jgi:hypothetical protein